MVGAIHLYLDGALGSDHGIAKEDACESASIGLHGGMLNGDVIYQLSEDAQKYLTELKDGAIKDGVKEGDIDIHVRFGEPKTVISQEFIEEYENDLIMIGSTGMNAVTRLLVGSVSEYVTRNARTDVIIVRTDTDNNKLVDKKKK